MTGAELLESIGADLYVAHMMRNAERPDGLTASSVGGCSQYGARTLLGVEEAPSTDFWRALRGSWIHDGMAEALAAVNPEIVDYRHCGRFVWQPRAAGMPPISGEPDLGYGPVMVEVKSRSRDECRWHATYGADEKDAMQAAQAAVAEGYSEAAVLYVPNDSGWEEAAACMVDIAAAMAKAEAWLERIDVRPDLDRLLSKGVPRDRALARVLSDIPREPHLGWCQMFCGHYKDCRGDYVPPVDLEIVDPEEYAAVQAANYWRKARLHAEREESAAKARLNALRTDGVASGAGPEGEDVRVQRRDLAPKGKRPHTRINIDERAPAEQ